MIAMKQSLSMYSLVALWFLAALLIPDSIVFVHGLTGSRLTTWTYETNSKLGESNKPWPELLLKDDIPNARILTFGYDANVVNFLSAASQNRVRDHASSLNATLSDLRDGTETVSILSAIKVCKFTYFELT